MTVRVVVADDQPVVRSGLAALLDSQDDITVVGTAADGAKAIALCRRAQPDVVLMDVRMPGMDGIEATRQLARPDAGAIKVLMLTTFDLDEYVYDALAAGASASCSRTSRQGRSSTRCAWSPVATPCLRPPSPSDSSVSSPVSDRCRRRRPRCSTGSHLRD